MRDAMIHEQGNRKPYIENLQIFATALHNKLANSSLTTYVSVRLTSDGKVRVDFNPITIDLSADNYYTILKRQLRACKLVDVLSDIDFKWLFENAVHQEEELRDDEINDLYEAFDDCLDRAFDIEFGIQNSVADQIIKNFYIYYGDE